MDNAGKRLRLKRIFRKNDRRCVIVPMDHGVTAGAVSGIARMAEAMPRIVRGGVDAIVMHKGFVSAYAGQGGDAAVIMHLSAGTRFYAGGNSKVLVASVEDAVRLGADAVSIHVTLGSPDENAMLLDFGRVGSEAARWGMPLLAMIYVRGAEIPNFCAAEAVGHAARLGEELGADIVKIPYCGNCEEFKIITTRCSIPVVIAGGEKSHAARDVLQLAYDGVRSGAAGVSIGRNVFQAQNPEGMTRALCAVIHKGYGVDEAAELLEQ